MIFLKKKKKARPVFEAGAYEYVKNNYRQASQADQKRGLSDKEIKESIMPVINTNNAANASLNYLNQNSRTATNLLSQLASGSRIIQAKDDAAGLAIGTQLNASIAVFQQASVNVQQGTSILNVADGALGQVANVLTRMLALAAQSASGQVTATQRTQNIQTEFRELMVEVDKIIDTTTYAGSSLIGASGILSSTSFLVGTQSNFSLSVAISSLNSTILGISGSSVSTSAAAGAAMDTLNSALNIVTTQRALVGAYQSQFSFSQEVIETNIQNTQAASSVLLDADVAQVKANLSTADVKVQAAVAALAQAAQLPQNLLQLIQS